MFAVSVLASGSSGNSVYVRAGRTSLLFDAGISRRELFSRLEGIGVKPERIDGAFLSHEHIDHSRSIGAVQRSLGIPVYATAGTLSAASPYLDEDGEAAIISGKGDAPEPVAVGDAIVTPVRVPHDAAEPACFVVEHRGKRLGIFTDLGSPTPQVKETISGLDCAVLEANHSIDMLWNGPYPLHLKQRIASPSGHLANEQAASLLMETAPERLSAVLLAHRSLHNNTAERAGEMLGHARTVLGERGGRCGRFALLHTSRFSSTGLVPVGKRLTAAEAERLAADTSAERVPSTKNSSSTLRKYLP